MARFRPGHLVVALTLFAALAVGATGLLLLSRYRTAALAAVADRQALLVSVQARLIDVEISRLVAEVQRLSQLAEVDLADHNLEPEKRVLRIARRDTVLFSVEVLIVDAGGNVVWSEPQGAALAASPAALVGEARGRERAFLSISGGEIDVAAPIAGRGAIVGKVSARQRDLFGDALHRAVRGGGGVELVQVAGGGGGAATVVASDGATVPAQTPSSGDGQAWVEVPGRGRWLVTEARLGGLPLTLRLGQPAAALEDEVAAPVRSLTAIVAGALVLAALGGGLLALAIGRLERAELEVASSRDLAAMGRAAAAIAHEVKNALNGLSVALDLLASGRAPAAAAEEVHALARTEITRLRGVADDLTFFGAAPRLELGEADLAELCRRATSACAALAKDCGARIALDLPGDDARVVVRGDAHKLLGAIQNVVRNGVESMGPGAFGEALGAPPPPRDRRLDVSLRQGGAGAVLEVADRGPGVAPDVAARLFEPFVSTKRAGTGLGLAIARRVVEAHGGHIEALPREGGGTVFRITLPSGAPAAKVRESRAGAGA